MAIGTFLSVNATKDIRRTGTAHGTAGAEYFTVLEFHRWLQDLADDASSIGDDLVDITKDTPTDKKFDTIIELLNGYNIDQDLSEYIYGGSVIQDNGAEIWDGVQIIANEGCYVQIHQNGTILANDFWNQIPNGETLPGLNRDVANGISAQFMVKVRNAGADIDGRRLVTQTREWGKTYSVFKINGTGRGVNVAALLFEDDRNNTTAVGTVAGWTTIDLLTEGYALLDVDNNGVDEPYYGEWTKATYSINQFYERMKWLSRRGSVSTLYGLDGDEFRGITHEVTLTTPRAGTFSAFEPVSWSGGTGQMLAINSTTAGTKMWIQLLTGVAPTNGQTITGGTSTATATASGAAVEKPLSNPFSGASTGASLIGAFGFGVKETDLSASDLITDLNGNTNSAPNYVTFTVGNLVSSVGEEDRVLVAPKAVGDGIALDQLSLQTALTGAAVTSVVVSTAIPSDTPATGTIRVQLNSGRYRRLAYTSWTGSTFTIASTDFTGDNASISNNVFVSYIDKDASAVSEAFTAIYSADRSLWIRVRNAGSNPIKTFETAGILGFAGGSVTTGRTSDL